MNNIPNSYFTYVLNTKSTHAFLNTKGEDREIRLGVYDIITVNISYNFYGFYNQ